MGFFAPNLTRLAAEGHANLLAGDAESEAAGEALRRAWPDQAYESLVVTAVHRSGGLTAVDLGYATRLARAVRGRRSAEGDTSRARARLAAGGRRAAAQQGRDGCARCRASVHFVRRPGDSRGDRLATVAGASSPARPAGRAGGALDGRCSHRTRLHEQRPDLSPSRSGRHRRVATRRPVRRLPLRLAGPNSHGDNRDQPGDLSKRPGLDDPRRMGGLAARRVVPGRSPFWVWDGFLSIRLVAFWRALASTATPPARWGSRWNGRRQHF